jgi:manganese transport protein
LSVIITIFIQNTAARIAWTTRKGLAQSSLEQSNHPLIRLLLGLLLIGAILIGNVAYEAGNLSGALIGLKGILSMEKLTFGGSLDWFPLLLGLVVGGLLVVGSFRFLKNSLIAIVVLMSVSFLLTAIMTKPDLELMLHGLFVPSFNTEEILTIVGLLGTTVVPYNLFLHAALVAQSPNVPFAAIKKDTLVAIGLGGIISLCIIISAAALEGAEVKNALDLGKALEPLYGTAAPLLLQFGFFAAGLTSALTAPMAAAFVVSECFSMPKEGWGYRITAFTVLAVGVYFTTTGIVPIEIIRFAQIANGILLPVIGLLLLFMVNNSQLMRGATPSKLQNSCFILIELFFIFLGIKSLGLIF